MASIGMDVFEESHGGSEIVHIHNYSMYAIKSLSCEIKKFPVIYKDSRRISFASQLIDLAWTRIISAVLDCEGTFTSTQMGYWNLSFRELWKWMRLMLVRDMRQRADNPLSTREPHFYWLDHLKFVERHIYLDEEAAEVKHWNPYIQVKLISEDTPFIETEKCTIIWLRDSREEANNENEGISIRFQSNVNACDEATTKLQTCPTSFSASDSKNFMIDASPSLGPSASFFGSIMSATCAGLPVEMPQEQRCMEIDEDYQFTMSLLPKLKALEPKMNMDVKLQILQALHDAF